MPICSRCGEHWYDRSWDSPAEPCACEEQGIPHESEEREPTEDELEQAREWQRALKGTPRRHEAEIERGRD